MIPPASPDAGSRGPLSRRGVAFGAAGAAAGVAVWVAMSAAFDLIFHLQPALVGLLAGWAMRRADGLGLDGARATAATGLSALGLAVGVPLLDALDAPRDPLWLTLLVGAAGAAGGLYLLSRRSAF